MASIHPENMITAEELKDVLMDVLLAAGGCLKARPSLPERARLRRSLRPITPCPSLIILPLKPSPICLPANGITFTGTGLSSSSSSAACGSGKYTGSCPDTPPTS